MCLVRKTAKSKKCWLVLATRSHKAQWSLSWRYQKALTIVMTQVTSQTKKRHLKNKASLTTLIRRSQKATAAAVLSLVANVSRRCLITQASVAIAKKVYYMHLQLCVVLRESLVSICHKSKAQVLKTVSWKKTCRISLNTNCLVRKRLLAQPDKVAADCRLSTHRRSTSASLVKWKRCNCHAFSVSLDQTYTATGWRFRMSRNLTKRISPSWKNSVKPKMKWRRSRI